jgi:hypothetical protein
VSGSLTESGSKPSSASADPAYGEPYCSGCGYVLTGAIESSKCPECGKPLVEVLARRGAFLYRGKRWRSKATLFGVPVIDVAYGPGPGQLRGHAKGIVALGDFATGVVAFGGMARGVVAGGGLSVGVFSFGGVAAGIVSAAGGLAVSGMMAVGGLAASAMLANGGLAVGALAQGGMAVGYYARGGAAMTYGPASPGSPEMMAAFDRFWFFFGPLPPTMASQLMTAASVVLPGLVIAMVTVLVALIMHTRQGGERVET